jgi:hypothetical protein
MKISNQNFDRLLGAQKRARTKTNKDLNWEHYFNEPIIHRTIHEDRVYVPLNLNRAWDKM